MADETTNETNESTAGGTPPPLAKADDTRAAKARAKAEEEGAAKSEAEHVYTHDELVAGAEGFGTTPAGMTAALHAAELQEATREDAQKAVDEFNEREVPSEAPDDSEEV